MDEGKRGRPIGSGPTNIEGTYDSVLKELSKYIKQLDTVRIKAMRMMNEVKDNTHDTADMIQLENVRSNAFKSFEFYFKLRLDALKLHAIIADKLSPKQNAEINHKLTKNDKEDSSVQLMLQELKKDFENKRKNGYNS